MQVFIIFGMGGIAEEVAKHGSTIYSYFSVIQRPPEILGLLQEFYIDYMMLYFLCTSYHQSRCDFLNHVQGMPSVIWTDDKFCSDSLVKAYSFSVFSVKS